MNEHRQRPLAVGTLRAFEAVARHLSFRLAAEELHLTQSAISRQIQSLEQEVGAPLFVRGTRHVELSQAGTALLRTVAPLLHRLDLTVRQIRRTRSRRTISVTTFASMASLWLIPRLEAFQREHPDLDIRVSACDAFVEVDGVEIDAALRYSRGPQDGCEARRLFGEVLTPVVSPWLLERASNGQGPPLRSPADLAQHTLLEEDDGHPYSHLLSWRTWLAHQGLPELTPQRWIYFNYTYQQVQASLTGQGVALARLPMVAPALASGELVEPFGPAGRLQGAHVYWLVVSPLALERPEVAQFCAWVERQATLTRAGVEAESDASTSLSSLD